MLVSMWRCCTERDCCTDGEIIGDTQVLDWVCNQDVKVMWNSPCPVLAGEVWTLHVCMYACAQTCLWECRIPFVTIELLIAPFPVALAMMRPIVKQHVRESVCVWLWRVSHRYNQLVWIIRSLSVGRQKGASDAVGGRGLPDQERKCEGTSVQQRFTFYTRYCSMPTASGCPFCEKNAY
jgi:hypothetical protein